MIQALEDIYLHLQSRQTNLNIPYSDYVSYDKYPVQNLSLLNNIYKIKYRDNYMMDMKALSYPSIERPYDDYPFIIRSEIGPEYNDSDEDYIHTKMFRIIRADLNDQHRAVMISEDYKTVLVCKSTGNDPDYDMFYIVHEYPIQDNRLLGLSGKTLFFDNMSRDAHTLAVDESNPLNSVIIEEMPDNVIRVILGDEVFFKILDEDIYSRRGLQDNSIPAMRQSYLEGKYLHE